VFESAYLAALARGYLATGHASGGIACVDRALKNCEASGEGWYVPELFRLRGELLLLEDAVDLENKAEGAFRRSLRMAREQGALAWELRTTVSCAKFYVKHSRGTEAKVLIKGVTQRIDAQGCSRDLLEANSLLAQL
jgi:predicted ATPase